MPYRPRKPCHHPGCPNLTAGMYCTLHQPQHKPDTQRPSAHRRGYTKRWQALCKPCHDRKTWTEDRFVSYGYGSQP